MKQITTRLLRTLYVCLIGLNIYTLAAQSSLSCYHGLKLAISQDPGWGVGKPIIYSVDRYSPAEASGLRAGHIVERIDGVATEGLSLAQVKQLLHTTASEHVLEVANIRERKTCLLLRHCRPEGALSEQELAQIFSAYSVEDARMLSTTYQHLYSRDTIVESQSIRTFAFAPSDSVNAERDNAINGIIRNTLRMLGFVEQTESPDVVILTDYALESLKSVASMSASSSLYSWHQDPDTGKIVPLPILPAGVSTDEAAYRISIGLSMISPSSPQTVIWRAESRDYLSSAMNLVDYARYMLPLMLSHFPMNMISSSSEYLLQTLAYNYTGIIYDPKDIGRIIDIDHNSPASASGLRIGDKIISINGHRLDGDSLEQLYADYQRFVTETMALRDGSYPAYQTVSDGQGLAPWAKEAYPKVAKAIQSNRSRAFFAYLFAFRPYVVDTPHVPIVMEIQRPGGDYTIELQPELRNLSSVIPLNL